MLKDFLDLDAHLGAMSSAPEAERPSVAPTAVSIALRVVSSVQHHREALPSSG